VLLFFGGVEAIPGYWTFRSTVETVAGTQCDYEGFRSEELEAGTQLTRGPQNSEYVDSGRQLAAIVQASFGLRIDVVVAENVASTSFSQYR